MKNFFPLKFIVILYSVFFLVPMILILKFSNTPIWIVIKIFLVIWMIGLLIEVFKKYSFITLGPFLCFAQLFSMLTWFLIPSWVSYISSFLLVVLFGSKFLEIDKIHKIYNERHADDKEKKVDPLDIIEIAKELEENRLEKIGIKN
jgi:hypothetical protein